MLAETPEAVSCLLKRRLAVHVLELVVNGQGVQVSAHQ
jgi:hypothetical protein